MGETFCPQSRRDGFLCWFICDRLGILTAMNKQEIAELLREEVGHLQGSIDKVQARCDRLKRLVLDIEEELHPTSGAPAKSILDGKFREVIDKVFGEKPKRPRAKR